MQPGVQPRSTLEHLRATIRTHTERALSNLFVTCRDKAKHVHMQMLYTHAITCIHMSVQQWCSAIRLNHNQETQERCPVETKNPVGKNKHYRQQKGSSSTRRLQCENTATHTHKAAKQSRQQVATLTSKSKSLRTSPTCQGSVRANMPECRGTEAQWNTTADY